MKDNSNAVLYLAERRDLTQSDAYKAFHSIPSRTGQLLFCDELILMDGQSLCIDTEAPCLLLVFPLVGEIGFEGHEGAHYRVFPGQLLAVPLLAGETCRLENMYQDAPVNLLKLGIRGAFEGSAEVLSFDLDREMDQLVPLAFSTQPVMIGKFNGRSSLDLVMDGPAFAYVIEGAFEVQYRLLEQRDALLVWDTGQLEIEALSNQAILVLLPLRAMK